MKIVSAAEMREIDRITTEKYGVPSLTLMENAGSAVAEFVLQEYPEAKRIGVICGKGNNGGDGFVAARKLHEAGKQVEVLLLADPAELKGDAAAMYKKLPVKAVLARNEKELKAKSAQRAYETDVIVDAILGTGFKPPVKGFYRTAIGNIWEALTTVVSVDLPSGVDADEMSSWPQSDEEELIPAVSYGVVTFTAPKLAHVFCHLTSRPVVVSHIGSPPDAVQSNLNLEVITSRDVCFMRGRGSHDSHKGDFGHVLVVGGSVGKAGAAALAGMAALRAGAGLVTVATARSALPTVAGFAPELMTEPLSETEAGTISMKAFDHGRMEALLKGKTVVAVGPGISRHAESAEFVRTLVERCEIPVILDADGLNAFEGCADQLDGRKRLLTVTPHPGEMARLTGLQTEAVQQDRLGVARKVAADHHCVVILKGWRTLVALDDGRVWVNTTGNPGMATGGTGDVLTGMVAASVAQYSSEGQQRVGRFLAPVHLHGLAGDLARKELGEFSMTATDLLRFLPGAFRWVEQITGAQVLLSGHLAPERLEGMKESKFVRISG
jgi:NAD(P)H-hydrate epimerase